MNGMTFAGRRGEIVWGNRGRHYDTFVVSFGFFVPFALGELVHVWDLPQTTMGACKAIKLRGDADFKKRVLAADWLLMGGIGLLIGSLFIGAMVHGALGALSFLVSVVLITFGIILMRQSARAMQIRLVLGPHAWGSSDPATWAKSVRQDIADPTEAFGVKSYEVLAKKMMKNGDWCSAMWAARLCAASENARTGDDLTDRILDEPDVQDRLAHLRRSPDDHKREFGKAPPLRQWLTCDPRTHVMEIG